MLHAIHSPMYWLILKKTILFSGLKNPDKKICERRKLESIHGYHFVERKNEDRKDSSLCPETSTKNAVQEFHLCWGGDEWLELNRDLWIITQA